MESRIDASFASPKPRNLRLADHQPQVCIMPVMGGCGVRPSGGWLSRLGVSPYSPLAQLAAAQTVPRKPWPGTKTEIVRRACGS